MDNRQSIAEKKQAVIDEANKMFSRGGIDIVKLCHCFEIKVFGDSDLDPNAFNAKITCESSKYEIVFNSNHPFTRIRFSIAHELAHFILHQEMITLQGLHRSEDGSTKEKDADD
ncbi:MAG: ImmA/IrrE family metallo-endopeptidase, partial [Chlamydiota bacterium]